MDFTFQKSAKFTFLLLKFELVFLCLFSSYFVFLCLFQSYFAPRQFSCEMGSYEKCIVIYRAIVKKTEKL